MSIIHSSGGYTINDRDFRQDLVSELNQKLDSIYKFLYNNLTKQIFLPDTHQLKQQQMKNTFDNAVKADKQQLLGIIQPMFHSYEMNKFWDTMWKKSDVIINKGINALISVISKKLNIDQEPLKNSEDWKRVLQKLKFSEYYNENYSNTINTIIKNVIARYKARSLSNEYTQRQKDRFVKILEREGLSLSAEEFSKNIENYQKNAIGILDRGIRQTKWIRWVFGLALLADVACIAMASYVYHRVAAGSKLRKKLGHVLGFASFHLFFVLVLILVYVLKGRLFIIESGEIGVYDIIWIVVFIVYGIVWKKQMFNVPSAIAKEEGFQEMGSHLQKVCNVAVYMFVVIYYITWLSVIWTFFSPRH